MADETAASFARRVLLIGALIAVFGLVFALRQVLLLALAAIILATLLDLIGALYRPLGTGRRLSILLAAATATGVVVLAAWVAGATVESEFSELGDALPRAYQALHGWLDQIGLDAPLQSLDPQNLSRQVMASAPALAQRTLEIGFQVLVVLFGALFLALDPSLYRNGLLEITPPDARDPIDRTIGKIAHGLRFWLLARLASMVLVGTLYGLAMTWIGVPGALAVGLVAGVLEFVPYVGPILGGGVATAAALTLGLEEALLALLATIVIQQLEGNVITPLIEQKAVRLPPALNVFSVISMATLFGPIGVFVASPTLLIVLTAVKELWTPRLRPEQHV